mmetsp:Transcript_54396/g.158004  ORF Transcript_54396/g.158004 Transcript_54396/m.158004 type:complete len:168 (-) Transcript_54396:357-860(-)
MITTRRGAAAVTAVLIADVGLLCMLLDDRVPLLSRDAWAVVLFPTSVVLVCLFYLLQDVHPPQQAPHPWTHDVTAEGRERYEAAFPAFPHQAGACGGRDAGDMCCICLEALSACEQVRRLRCGHDFHRQCIDEWLFRGQGRIRSCPKCRRPVFVVPPALLGLPGGRP